MTIQYCKWCGNATESVHGFCCDDCKDDYEALLDAAEDESPQAVND